MTALMRMQIVSQNNPNLPHYQRIVSQLSKRWNIPLVRMRQWISKYVSGFCGWLKESVYRTLSALRWGHWGSLFLPAVTVLCCRCWLQIWCVPILFYFLNCFMIVLIWQPPLTVSGARNLAVQTPLVLATKKHLVTTGYVRIYRHGNSAQKFGASTPIVATSNQILGKAFSAALLYCVVWCEYICVELILCAWCLWGMLARKSLIARPRGFEIRLSCIVLYSPLSSFALKLCSTLSPLEQNDETHLALRHPPKGGGLGCSPVPLSLMLDTRLQSPLHQSRGLGIRPSSSWASCRTHMRETGWSCLHFIRL